MALLDILKMVEASEGIPCTSDADQKALATARINEAARELYEDQDFPESKREDIFNIDVSSQVVALPWYVEYVRGWRYFNSRLPGIMDAKDNRYGEGKGNEVWYNKWRTKGHFPLEREISNESTLRFTIPQAEDSIVEINIVGETSLSSRYQETVNIPVGSLDAETVSDFVSVRSIIKKNPCKYDITVLDADDNVMSVIPNNRTHVLYHWIQLFDWDNMYLTTTSAQVEILYKEKLSDLVNDYDEFLFGDKYDKAIYWKYLAHQSKDQEVTAGFELKCDDLLNKIHANESIGTRRVINFRKSPYLSMPYGQPFGPHRQR